MSRWFDTHVEGEPAALRAAAHHLLLEVGRGLGDAGDRMAGERRAALAAWQGAAAQAFADRVATTVAAGDRVQGSVCALGWRLDELAAALEAVLDGMAAVREQAVAEGLRVQGTVVSLPPVATAVGVPLSPHEQGLTCVVAALEGRADGLRAQWSAALSRGAEHVAREEESIWEATAPLVVAGWHAGLVAAAAPHLAGRVASLTAVRTALADRWTALRTAAAERRLPPREPSPLDRLGPGWRAVDRGLGAVDLLDDLGDVRDDVEDGEPLWQAVASQGASMAVVAGSTALGGWAGGALGTLAAPGPGTVVGAASGAALGSAAGERAGNRADALVDHLAEREEREEEAAQRARDEARIRSLLLAGDRDLFVR